MKLGLEAAGATSCDTARVGLTEGCAWHLPMPTSG